MVNKKVSAIYLAAGASRRMGTSKLAIELEAGVRLGGIALESALHSKLSRIAVVMRPEDEGEWLPAAYSSAEQTRRVLKVVCPDASQGMAHSLRSGLEALRLSSEEGLDAVMVLLGDQPFVGEELIHELLERFDQAEGADYCAACHEGKLRPPIVLAASMFEDVMRLDGDEGARSLLRSTGYRGLSIEVGGSRCFWDADTPEDVEFIRNYYRSEA